MIDPDTVIRPMSDDDRDGLWSGFGGPTGIVNPAQLYDWTRVIDIRWKQSREPPRSDQVAIDRVANVVTALRLHHPGIFGTTILWNRLDPPDGPFPGFGGQDLWRPHGDPKFVNPPPTSITPDDGPALKALLGRIEAALTSHRLALALRRFDSAYERLTAENSLIDLWIAFESVFSADSITELSYRASLRIAWLAGSTADERRAAFDLARDSYKARSKDVHRDAAPDDLHQVLDDTQQLARKALAAWLENPPDGGVQELDHKMLE